MHWIYILNCENEIGYVGETKNLYSRLNQHVNGKGSKHTVQNKPISLCGLYKVHTYFRYLSFCKECESDSPRKDYISDLLDEFNTLEWNNKDWARHVEDFMTEVLMQYNDITTYGGKYVNDNREELEKTFSVAELNRVPLCDCGFPCEIKISTMPKYIKLYFVCSMKNVWHGMRKDYQRVEMETPCGFYQECMDHIQYRLRR